MILQIIIEFLLIEFKHNFLRLVEVVQDYQAEARNSKLSPTLVQGRIRLLPLLRCLRHRPPTFPTGTDTRSVVDSIENIQSSCFIPQSTHAYLLPLYCRLPTNNNKQKLQQIATPSGIHHATSAGATGTHDWRVLRRG